MFSLKGVFFLVFLFAVGFWGLLGGQNAASMKDFGVPSGFARLWQLNSDEALVSVGDGTRLRVTLEDGTGYKTGEQVLGEGLHVLRIDWGGPKGQFGFTSKGHSHTIPTNYTECFNSLGCIVFPESRETLASAFSSGGDELASVVLEVSETSSGPE